MIKNYRVSAFTAALFAAGGAHSACNKAEIQFLQAGGYSVGEAMAWCNGTSSDGKVAMQTPSSTPKSTTSPSIVSSGSPGDKKDAGETGGKVKTGEKEGEGDKKVDKNVFAGTPPDSINGWIRPSVRIPGFVAAGERDPSGGKLREFYFPAQGKFLITNDVIATPDGETKPVELLYGRANLRGINEGDPNLHTDKVLDKRTYSTYLTDGSRTPYVIYEDVEYVVKRAQFANHENLRQGYTYGLLTAPYKFYPKDRSFSSSATIGPYIGWQYVVSDYTLKWVGSFGLSSVPVTTTKTTGESTTSNRAALSLSTGVLFDISNKFQIGLLLGADTLGPNSGYQYNGKPWLAIDIGYKFSN